MRCEKELKIGGNDDDDDDDVDVDGCTSQNEKNDGAYKVRVERERVTPQYES